MTMYLSREDFELCEMEAEREANRFDATPHCDTAGQPALALQPVAQDDPREPPVGTWAFTARVMAKAFPDFDWDAWKDEMKESDVA